MVDAQLTPTSTRRNWQPWNPSVLAAASRSGLVGLIAMTCGYHRTSSPVTALPMIMRWISDVPSKFVKVVDARAVFRR